MRFEDIFTGAVDDTEQSGEENTPDPQILSNDKESGFSDWYAQHAEKQGLNPNPDDPRHNYDYRAAYGAGAVPDEAGHLTSQFKGPKHENLVIDGVNTKTGEKVPGPTIKTQPDQAITMPEVRSEADFLNRKPGQVGTSAADQVWKKFDESRGLSADQFRKTASETLSKLATASGKASLASPEMVELLGLTAANETQLDRYRKKPGTSTQRGMMQITDGTADDIYRWMGRDPNLLQAVDSLRDTSKSLYDDLDTNIPLNIAMASMKYAMTQKGAIPSDIKGMARVYKTNYNTYHPKAKATPSGAAAKYRMYFT